MKAHFDKKSLSIKVIIVSKMNNFISVGAKETFKLLATLWVSPATCGFSFLGKTRPRTQDEMYSDIAHI